MELFFKIFMKKIFNFIKYDIVNYYDYAKNFETM